MNDGAYQDISNLFPGQIKVYDLLLLETNMCENSCLFLYKNFSQPLNENEMKKLVTEIAACLKDKDADAVYSFFHRSAKSNLPGAEWFLSCARLEKCKAGMPKEIIIFSYNLQWLGSIKQPLYHVLENDAFFKDNFNKASLLTKREKEIIQLLSRGMSSAQIAAACYISVHTVNTHRKKINEKLDLQNFAALLKFAEVFELNCSS